MPVETNRATLINLLLSGYDDLKRRLARRLGSTELAADALHDTFLRLNSKVVIGQVERPEAYLLGVAVHLAASRRKAETLGPGISEIELSFDLVDEAPDPARIVEARSDIEALKRGMMELPRRRREILMAASLEDVPYPVLAQRFGVSVRTIQSELKLALTHCAKALDRDLGSRMPRRGRMATASPNSADSPKESGIEDDEAAVLEN